MAPEQDPSQPPKRKLPPKVAAMKARKRVKLHSAATSSRKVPKPTRRNVRLDELDWKEVAMPDRLDDFEGFYGLEEIDGVEVVKNEGDGIISFRRAGEGGSDDGEDAEEDGKAGMRRKMEEQTDTGGRSEGPEEEWSGFSDANDASEDNAMAEPPRVRSQKGTEREKRKDKATQKTKNAKGTSKAIKSSSHDETNASNPFHGLEGEHLDDNFDTSAWATLQLSPETLSAISELGFSEPTPIQSAAIPEILDGHDVIGKAVTGSGKTLAFGIPMLEHYLMSRRQMQQTNAGTTKRGSNDLDKRRPPVALIIAPTRELAHQISKHLTALCSSGSLDGPSIATVTGGLSVQKQLRVLATADIVIGTPGRLWEVLSEGKGLIKWLKRVKFVIVDEADRLLSEGHFKEFEEILNILDKDDEEQEEKKGSSDERRNDQTQSKSPTPTSHPERQTLVFSATFHKGLQQKLAGKARAGGDLMDTKQSLEYLLRKLRFREAKPKFVDTSPTTQLASGLQEGIVECGADEKDLYLYTLLLQHTVPRTLVFTNSIPTVRRLQPLITNLGLQTWSLHSQMPQKARLRSLERFTATATATAAETPPPAAPSSKKNATTRPTQAILIATDLAARGLDLPAVDLVVHYHAPRTADAYIHRSGRTARAHRPGCSALLCSPAERAAVARLLRKIHGGGTEGPRTLALDRLLASRLRERTRLAKRIADVEAAWRRERDGDRWMREAAEELGVDEGEMEAMREIKAGRSGRRRRDRDDEGTGRGEVEGWRRELKGLLGRRVNVGVSEKYVANGIVDVESLLGGGDGGRFLGSVQGVGFV